MVGIAKRALVRFAPFAAAAALAASVAPGCGGTPLAPALGGSAGSSDAAGATGTTAGAAGTAGAIVAPPTGAAGGGPTLTIPDDVGLPVVSCPDGPDAFLIDLPCKLGMAPVSELDCGIVEYPDVTLKLVLPASLPDALGGAGLVLGQPTRFAADLLPFQGNPSQFFGLSLQSMTGTVVFTKLSFADATLDGWFPNLDIVWSGTGTDGAITTFPCQLKNARFTAVPGGFF